jgi:acyl-CoA thioesterase
MDSEIARLMSDDRFAALNGIELVSVEEGRALARMELTEDHNNFLGTVHGGAIFALADVAFAAAANSHGNRSMAFHISIEYLGPPGETPFLEAEVRETGRAGRAGHYSMEVRNSSGVAVAVLNGWAYGTSKPLIE